MKSNSWVLDALGDIWAKQTVLYYMPQEWKNEDKVKAGKISRSVQLDRAEKAKQDIIRQKGLESLRCVAEQQSPALTEQSANFSTLNYTEKIFGKSY
jgi:hypothetical protein